MTGGGRKLAGAWSGKRGVALILVCGLWPGPGHAQAAAQKNSTAAADAAEAAEEAKDEILVTAHLQHGAVATDIPPEATLNSRSIRALGAADLDEVLEDLAPEIKNGASEAGEAGQTPIVLVNGQRIAGFSQIRDLPPEAVRRIEIFPEKVALQYGFTPDQRVVNIVLRSQYHALTLIARDTLAPDTWRGIYRAKADLVHIGANSHWNLDLDYHHQDPIYAEDTLAGPSPPPGAKVPAYTTSAQSDQLSINGAGSRNFGPVTAELTGRLDLGALQSRLGLSDEDGALLAQENLSNLATGPRNRLDRTVEAQTSLTLNGKLDSWRWSFIGRLDGLTRVTRTNSAFGAEGFDAILVPTPTLLGHRCNESLGIDCVSTTTRTASGDFYLNGNVFPLPAGDVTASLHTGFAFSGIRSDSPYMAHAIDRSRDEGSAQGNLDFPITSRHAAVGKLSAGVNGEVHRVSSFGTLSTLGSTLEWSPVERAEIIASFSRAEQAPSLTQLDEATLETPDLREFDFVNDNTAIITRSEGGNADLRHETSRIGSVRLQLKPLRSTNFALSAEYTIERARNPVASITAATPATMAAFPSHFTRSTDGFLTAMDVSPVNLARRDRQQLRWGINWSTPFGAARPEPPSPGGGPPKPPVRNQFQLALYHTWRFQDDVVLRNGLPTLDLLNNDIISDRGGTPAHEIELQSTIAFSAWSASINAQWQSETKAFAGPMSNDRVRFTQGVTVNLRVQINLAAQHWLMHLLPWLHGNLNLSADNILGAHLNVHDADGAVPLAYTESYLNPTGRTFRITLRKRFR